MGQARYATATIRFQNKGASPVILAYVWDSGLATDDRGNRFRLVNEQGVRGIGLISGQTVDAKFVLQPNAGSDARFEFVWAPSTSNDLVGSQIADMEVTVRELVPEGGSQYSLGAEHLLHYNDPKPASAAPSASRPAAPLTSAVPPAVVPTSAAPTAAAAAPGGIKVGDPVSVNSAFGWMNGKVLAIRGNSFYVHNQVGADVWKDYPAEIRRIGPPTAADHAAGIYELHDKVQANIGGQWMEGVVITAMGMEYQVQLPGNRTAWVQPPNLRPSTAPPPALPKAGQPPKPGLTSCAGKIEGRYSSMGGFAGLTIVFRSGKATLADDDVYECWMGGGKIYLHKPGGGPLPDMPLDINGDGTLDSPMGELKKKGN